MFIYDTTRPSATSRYPLHTRHNYQGKFGKKAIGVERKFLDFLFFFFFFFVVVVDERSTSYEAWIRGLNIGKFDWKGEGKVILRCLISR